jgi:UDP-N-acetylmuramoylalanine--D-glutamate ligase
MRISALLERPVLLLGAGREGLATLALLRARGYRRPVPLIADQAPAELPPGLSLVSADAIGAALAPDCVVVRSPGFAPHHPLRRQLDDWGGAQTTATRLMLTELAASRIPVIGVTASKGKSTISTLIQALLTRSNIAATLVGNIGVPALSRLDTILQTRPVVVIELSSYQCDDLPAGEGPGTVVFGSLFPEHLDWHGSLAAYYGAKARLLAAAPAGGTLLVHQAVLPILTEAGLAASLARTDISLEWVNTPNGLHPAGQGFMDGERLLCKSAQMRLPGRHNRENACLALAAARRFGVGSQQFEQVLAAFEGLPFRLQQEGVHAGIHWINDSISTAPEAACAGLEAFGGAVHTLITGGQDRGYDYAPLVAAIAHWQVGDVILLPESGAAIAAAAAQAARARQAAGQLDRGHHASRWHTVGNLGEAVQLAAQLTEVGGVCLFSPAAPSYHAWSGFEARGQDFRAALQALPPPPANPHD